MLKSKNTHQTVARALTSICMMFVFLCGCSRQNGLRSASDSSDLHTSSDQKPVSDGDLNPPGYENAEVPVPVSGTNLASIESVCESSRPDQVPCSVVRYSALISRNSKSVLVGRTTVAELGIEQISWDFTQLPSHLHCAADDNYHPTCMAEGGISLTSKQLEARLTVQYSDGTKTIAVNTNPPQSRPPLLACPAGYVTVNSKTDTGDSDRFCVMKYEAKEVSGMPASIPDQYPLFAIRGADENDPMGAWHKCKALGSGYDLISNNQWQAVARDIESTRENWSGGMIGSGALSQGHSDSDPADTMTNHGCPANVANVKGSCNTPDPAQPFSQQRTHLLSSGEILWDFAGNALEWVIGSPSASGANIGGNNPCRAHIAQIPWLLSAENCGTIDLSAWTAKGDYSGLSGLPFAGLGHFMVLSTSPEIRRGGASFDPFSGVFSAVIGADMSYGSSNGSAGFRCIWRP